MNLRHILDLNRFKARGRLLCNSHDEAILSALNSSDLNRSMK
jgi:hypothetical protein